MVAFIERSTYVRILVIEPVEGKEGEEEEVGGREKAGSTMVDYSQEYRRKYWATRSSVRSLAHSLARGTVND